MIEFQQKSEIFFDQKNSAGAESRRRQRRFLFDSKVFKLYDVYVWHIYIQGHSKVCVWHVWHVCV